MYDRDIGVRINLVTVVRQSKLLKDGPIAWRLRRLWELGVVTAVPVGLIAVLAFDVPAALAGLSWLGLLFGGSLAVDRVREVENRRLNRGVIREIRGSLSLRDRG